MASRVQTVPPIVLASQSPRRAQLMELIGLEFAVAPADVDETYLSHEEPAAHAERLAREKAKAGAALWPKALVVGSDTVVVLDGEVLGKPRDEAQALAMLMRLQGREHRVLTGVAVAAPATGPVAAATAVAEAPALSESYAAAARGTGDHAGARDNPGAEAGAGAFAGTGTGAGAGDQPGTGVGTFTGRGAGAGAGNQPGTGLGTFTGRGAGAGNQPGTGGGAGTFTGAGAGAGNHPGAGTGNDPVGRVVEGRLVSGVENVRVRFRAFDEQTALEYIATGEPMDKAGAYGIQGFGATIVECVEGDYFAVMGLAIGRMIGLFRELGWRYNFRGLESL